MEYRSIPVWLGDVASTGDTCSQRLHQEVSTLYFRVNLSYRCNTRGHAFTRTVVNPSPKARLPWGRVGGVGDKKVRVPRVAEQILGSWHALVMGKGGGGISRFSYFKVR